MAERAACLEIENRTLWGENNILRFEIERLVREMRRHQEIAAAAKTFSKDMALNLKNLQDATLLMRRRERSADKEWESFKGSVAYSGGVDLAGALGSSI